MQKLLYLFLLMLMAACKGSNQDIPTDIEPRQAMRDFVVAIADSARKYQPNFIVIPQNGQELATADGTATGEPILRYLQALDGVGREDLFYGYNSDNKATPVADRDYLLGLLEVCAREGLTVLTTDYCSDTAKMHEAYRQNQAFGYLSFPAPSRDLEVVPGFPSRPFQVNTASVSRLVEAQNFLYLINPGNFPTKTAFLSALAQTEYDVLILDAFFNETPYLPAELDLLRFKPGGGKRLLIAYMSIGEAEDYRYYWQSGWKKDAPTWLAGQNPQWKGNYKVRYWDKAWQALILDPQTGYLKKILDAGFDGVYLDIIDAFEYFE